MTLVTTTSFVRGAAGRPKVATLTRDLRRDLRRGHPWVFADAVRLPGGLAPGETVIVEGKDKKAIGLGYVDPEGPLAVRMLSADGARPEGLPALLEARLEAAVALRERLFDASVTGYRVVNGEGDGLPGLVIDRYEDVAVVKPDGPVADAFWDTAAIARWLAGRLPVSRVYLRRRSRGGAEGEPLIGDAPGLVTIREGGARLAVDVVHGQKTGLFLDQREHRMRIGAMARGRRVLNVFGYTGGFSVHAGLGGASHVTTVDLAAPAIAQAEANWALNGLPAEGHRGVAADAFAFLEAAGAGERWDLVVLDPPAFAPSRQALPQALAAYRRMVTAGARVTADGGLVLVASCSAHVSLEALLGAIEEGVGEARRRADVLAVGGQPPDHPYPLACRELAYLKAVTLRLR